MLRAPIERRRCRDAHRGTIDQEGANPRSEAERGARGDVASVRSGTQVTGIRHGVAIVSQIRAASAAGDGYRGVCRGLVGHDDIVGYRRPGVVGVEFYGITSPEEDVVNDVR